MTLSTPVLHSRAMFYLPDSWLSWRWRMALLLLQVVKKPHWLDQSRQPLFRGKRKISQSRYLTRCQRHNQLFDWSDFSIRVGWICLGILPSSKVPIKSYLYLSPKAWENLFHILAIKPVISSGNRPGRSESLHCANIASFSSQLEKVCDLEWGTDHEYN